MHRFPALRLIRPDCPDSDLLAAFRDDRDEDAFAELVRRHGPMVWGVCRRHLPDRADAEDAFQAVFLVLVRRAGHLTDRPTVAPWLHRVAALTARDLRRKNARRLARTRPLPADVPAPPPAPVFDLDAAVLALPAKYRGPVVLCYFHGLTQREAAARLGCREKTLSAHVSRGLARLREKLAGRDAVALLAAAAVPVPAAVSAAATRAAVALQIASTTAAASPAAVQLTEGVLRMFWYKKLTAVGAAVLVAAGIGVGLGVRSGPRADAADKVPDVTPVVAVAEPVATDPITRLRQLDAETARLLRDRGSAAAAEIEAIAAERKGLFAHIDHKTRPAGHYMVSVGLDPGGQPAAAVSEYDANGHLAAYATTPGLGFVERYLARTVRQPKSPSALVLYFAPDTPPDAVRATFAACKAAGASWVWVSGTLPAAAGKDGVVHPGSGGEIRYAHGRAVYARVILDVSQIDPDGIPQPVPFDLRC